MASISCWYFLYLQVSFLSLPLNASSFSECQNARLIPFDGMATPYSQPSWPTHTHTQRMNWESTQNRDCNFISIVQYIWRILIENKQNSFVLHQVQCSVCVQLKFSFGFSNTDALRTQSIWLLCWRERGLAEMKIREWTWCNRLFLTSTNFLYSRECLVQGEDGTFFFAVVIVVTRFFCCCCIERIQ